MERLTFLNGDDYWCVTNDNCFEEQSEYYCGPAIDRLAAYEDSGFTPQEIRSLHGEWDACKKALDTTRKMLDDIMTKYGLYHDGMGDAILDLLQARKDGHLLVLPCKVGDTVWTNISVQGDRYRLADRPYPVKVVFLGMGEKSAYFHVEYDNGRVFPFDFDQFGKTVFLTREEAEAVLEGEGNG